MFVLSWDPGGTLAGTNKASASGWCYQDQHKVYGGGGLHATKDLHAFLAKWDVKKLPVDFVVIEEYIVRGQAQNQGKKMVTSEAIGSITMWASMNQIPVVMQDARHKPAMEKMTGVYPKKASKRQSHLGDAYNHGRYYLIKQGLAKTVLELEMGL